jgi:alpha-glucosidase
VSIIAVKMSTVKLFTVKTLIFIALCGISGQLNLVAQPVSQTLRSPNGRVKVDISRNGDGKFFYRTSLDNQMLIDTSPLGLETNRENFSSALTLERVERNTLSESYTLTTGKRKDVRYECNELRLLLRNATGKPFVMVFRAFNDGMAFCYELTEDSTLVVTAERSAFNIPQMFKKSFKAWGQTFNLTYENYYEPLSPDESIGREYVVPMLVQVAEKKYVLLTEAAVLDNYPASRLVIQPKGNLKLKAADDSIPCRSAFDRKSRNVFRSPWRVAIVGDPKTIVETTMIEDLAPPAQTTDVSWIEPGTAVFPWWSDNYVNSNEKSLRRFVDAAAELKWKWIEFDVGLVGDPYRAVKNWDTTAWIKPFTRYAESKKINVYGWDEYVNLDTPEKRAYIFGRYNELGIKGIKIDFIDSDSRRAMAFRIAALQDALRHRLHVSFHGETAPRGLRRAFPNIMTNEAIRGEEYTTWRQGNGKFPAHNVITAFSRAVVGSMDYTPTAFSSTSRYTTYTHELALALLYESGWQCMCDKPEEYLNSPARPLLEAMPTTWDETRYIDGEPGKYICLARRNGTTWYLAAINAGDEQSVTLPLNFLGNETYQALIFKDDDAALYNTTKSETRTVTKNDKLQLKLGHSGGCAVKFSSN